MQETDVYGSLANWLKTKLKLEWSKNTHENPCIYFNEDEVAEADLILGTHKNNQLTLTDVVHVKTKDNLQNKKDRYQLLGKAKFTLSGAPRVWLAIEKSTFRTIDDALDNAIGVVTYEEKGDNVSNLIIKREPKREDIPKFLKHTNELVNKKFGKIVETTQNIFLCSMNPDN